MNGCWIKLNNLWHINQISPSEFSSVYRALAVESWSSTDFLPQCWFFFFKSEKSELKASLCAGLVFLPSRKAYDFMSYFCNSKPTTCRWTVYVRKTIPLETLWACSAIFSFRPSSAWRECCSFCFLALSCCMAFFSRSMRWWCIRDKSAIVSSTIL